LVGLARVQKEAYPDPTAKEGDWSCIDLAAGKPLAKLVTLAAVKAEASLKDIALVRNSRLSVQPLSKAHFDYLMKMAGT
jgi:predicted RNA-binding protein with PUA-like domain